MKNKITLLSSLIIVITLSSCQSLNNNIDKSKVTIEAEKSINISDIQNFKIGNLDQSEDTKKLRIIKEAAYLMGFRAGKYNASLEIMRDIKKYKNKLDELVDFSNVIYTNSILPPVITQAQDIVKISPRGKTIISKAYRIEKPAKFVSTLPTWEIYLLQGINVKDNEVKLPTMYEKPSSLAEKKAWAEAVKNGANDGYDYAYELLEKNFAILTRDYIGMMNYTILLHNHMVSAPIVLSSKKRTRVKNNQIIINWTDQTLVIPKFLPENKWKRTGRTRLNNGKRRK